MRTCLDVRLLGKIGEMTIVRARKDVRFMGKKWENGYNEDT